MHSRMFDPIRSQRLRFLAASDQSLRALQFETLYHGGFRGLAKAAKKFLRLRCVLPALALVAWSAASSEVQKRPPNVILITIDTVRADRLGCYGAKNAETPTLDSLAHDGIVFERAISQVPLTWPSHTVILTGTYPFQNGVQDFTSTPLESRFRSVAEAFKDHGYRTGAVVSSFVLDRSWGLARGFDFYDDAFSPEQFKNRDLGLVERPAGESVTRALVWLGKSPQRPFFFWLHLYDPHSPYDPPEPYRTKFEDGLYDGEIAYADHEVGRLIAWLKRNRIYSGTSIVMLSDHGESLGEHGEHEHGFFLYNSTLRIPLILKPAAGSSVKQGRIPRPVETTSIAPTLLKLAGIADAHLDQQFVSNDLFANSDSDGVAYSETFYAFSSFGWSPLHGIETERYHYIDAPTPELYDLNSDPTESKNIVAQQSATVAVLRDKLQQRLALRPFKPSETGSSNLDPDAAEKLRELGYVAYRSPVSAEVLKAGLPDPKNKIEEFNTILEAQDAMRVGNVPLGEALFAKVQQQDRNLYIVHFSLGEAAARSQNWERSVAEFQRCLELNPTFEHAMTGLARVYVSLGRLDEAKRWALEAIKRNSQNYRAWYALGFIDSQTSKAAAIDDYLKALAIQNNFAPLHRDLGLLYFQTRNYDGAITHLSKAVELGLNDAQLFNFLGISYSRVGALPKAIFSYRKAIEVAPQMGEAHLNLGFAYQKINKLSAAKAEYSQACKLESRLCSVLPRM
jgi:arylsulfatase A-like enzyme/Flp pilus assembly protein TadD